VHELFIYIICQGPEHFFQLFYKLVLLYSFKLKINIYTLKAFAQTFFDSPNNYISDNPGQVVFFLQFGTEYVCMYIFFFINEAYPVIGR